MNSLKPLKMISGMISPRESTPKYSLHLLIAFFGVANVLAKNRSMSEFQFIAMLLCLALLLILPLCMPSASEFLLCA